ncbi:hypothetical protein PILCRDRAFT_85377 [Piloderma croceum F 1598]|uniref:6-phosphogluconate dehydrogenase NADP-binding domain-containing protein n=1 Tax=Piloderma croceum (strain F 1598) TaxID=765440 RepID=A0A0C3BR14_PILCF|nr:hypothetical protein PILCRDRAFT_85377 [Piloderma croceum F 1598]
MSDETTIPAMHPAHPQIPFSRPATPQTEPRKIGFYGLGNIGYLMARNLATHKSSVTSPVSPPLLVYNRTVSKSEKLVKEVGGESKIRIAQSAAQLAIECDVIITNLANDDVVKHVYVEFSKALAQSPPTKNKIFVETSTIYPCLAGELNGLISQHPRSHLITCPVFGTPPVADKALMVFAMSGNYQSKKEVSYLLVPAVGRQVYDLGENLEKVIAFEAPTFKLIGNSMVLGCLEVLAEAQTMSKKSGLGAEAAYDLVKELLSAGPFFEFGTKMLNDSFDGTKGFGIDGGIKDASHMRRLTQAHNSPMPAVDAAHSHLLTARALYSAQKLQGTQQFDTLDSSALVAGARVAAGLDGFDSGKHSKVIKE